MTIEIKWTDTDPETGERRFLAADYFARTWKFRWKLQRRGDWNRDLTPTKEMWEFVLDSMERRHQRREGVTEADVKLVKKIIAEWQDEDP